jgi:hypothetical protein
MAKDTKPRRGSGKWKLLLLLPFIALLWVPSYNRAEPSLAGFPFFYWYQGFWLLLTSLITYIVHRKTERA